MEPTDRTEGQKLLRAWIAADPGRTQGSVARALKISQPAVGYWVKGTSRPEPMLRAALKVLCGIEESAWELPEERAKREATMAQAAGAADAEASSKDVA